MANRVIHFEIQADDIERAKKFYEKVFGWKVEKMMGADQGGMDYWGLTTGPDGTPGINGGMYQRPKDRKLTTFDCTITVDDIDKAIAEVKKSGGKIRQEKMEIPHVGLFAGGIDTEGNIFGLMQPTEWKPKGNGINVLSVHGKKEYFPSFFLKAAGRHLLPLGKSTPL